MERLNNPVRVRFAPSPTGRTHLGSARTALFNYLIAKQTGGKFILRLEDTDQKRYVPGAEIELMEGLRWLGLDWDEGPEKGGPHEPYRQSERKEIYKFYAEELIQKGHAFYCFCTPERLQQVRVEQLSNKQPVRYDGTCRWLDPSDSEKKIREGLPYVIRFRMPLDGSITVVDRLRGAIMFDNRNLDDYIIVKSDGLALYHLAAMVDDHMMEVTHVIRSAEWLSTFALHAHIIRAFGWNEPEWVHLSIFLKPSGKGKMSKRESSELLKDGYSIFLGDLRQLGYIPEAVVNWIALMGWSLDDHTEFFNMSDLVKEFSFNRCNPAPAAINFSKLDHFNGQHIRRLKTGDLTNRLKPFFEAEGYSVSDEKLKSITPLLQERIVTLDDAPVMAGFLFEEVVIPKSEELIIPNLTVDKTIIAAQRTYDYIISQSGLNHTSLDQPLRKLAEELGLTAGQLFGFLRVALTGQKISPPLLETMEVIGKDVVLKRIQNAIIVLQNLSNSPVYKN